MIYRKLGELEQLLGKSAFKVKKDEKTKELLIKGITSDSREVKEGFIFYVQTGLHVDGRDYIKEAIEKGAIALMGHKNLCLEKQVAKRSIPVLIHDTWISHYQIANFIYSTPSKRIKLVGVTGTNGKSTVTNLVAQLLSMQNKKVALMGTLGTGYLDNLQKSANTTPDAFSLQRKLQEYVDDKCEYVIMEVSSIGVDQKRIGGCIFTAGAFTNFTQDHLDYHKTMEKYFECKEEFIKQLPPLSVVLNVNDPKIKTLANSKTDGINVGINISNEYKHKKVRYLSLENISYHRSDVEFTIVHDNQQFKVKSHLLGRFNVENMSVAIGIMLALGYPLGQFINSIALLKPICGRMECFVSANKPNIIVDYAHTPDGVENALNAAREHMQKGKLICILGAGGSRDVTKRPLMAIKACVLADFCIFTSDNPRDEDPMTIIEDMILGVGHAKNYSIEVDRKKAIDMAYQMAKPEDTILICGKGHEDYQIFKDKTIFFSDRLIAQDLLGIEHDKV